MKFISFDFPIENKQEITQKFADAFTSNTKVVNITHMINWVGQILPVNEIAAEARQRNIEVIVDGAHTFAHLDFKISDLDSVTQTISTPPKCEEKTFLISSICF